MLDTFTRVCSHKDHTILILGEGNFSFAKDLAKHEKEIEIHATSLDSKETVYTNTFAQNNINEIKHQDNVVILHSVDATRLDECLAGKVFSVIIFNFPHTGGKSNIRKCRKLLEDFFVSAWKHLCCDGRVVVALCKGQGGTPLDATRGNYGNSWKIATCASKAGFLLREVIPFDSSCLENYSEAGYRGEIHQKFFTYKAFIHIFVKGKRLEEQTVFNLEERGRMHQLDEVLNEQSKIEYIYDSYFNNQTNLLYDQLEELLSYSITEKLKELNIQLLQIDNITKYNSTQFTDYNKTLFSLHSGHTYLNFLPRRDSYKLCFYSANLSVEISPYNYPLTHQVCFILNTENTDPLEVESSILDHVQSVLLKHFETSTVQCCCSAGDLTKCECLTTQVSPCSQPYLKQYSSTGRYDEEKVPNFIEDIAVSFWTSFQPEIVVTNKRGEDHKVDYEDSNSSSCVDVVYEKQSCSEYELSNIERKHCIANIPCGDNDNGFASPMEMKKIVVNGRCVACIGSYINNGGHCSVVLSFHSNEMFLACYGVPDLRYLWCGDGTFCGDILKQLEHSKDGNSICPPVRTYQTLIKHPLCYRHDLCFWLDEVHNEQDLFQCIRLTTRDLVHSVRLLKVLRHEETNCVSYCYRMMYGRLDGPLSHEETVKLQNKLRLYLLDLQYGLR